MDTTSAKQTLLNDLVSSGARNFFWNGHGDDGYIGSAVTDSDFTVHSLSRLESTDVANTLHNRLGKKGWQERENPYRLVILNGCKTASPAWARAFGIEDKPHSKAWFLRKGEESQAFVGWKGYINVPSGNILHITAPITFLAYSSSLAVLFSDWMDDLPLAECLADASDPTRTSVWDPWSFPLDPTWEIFGDPNLTRDPEFEP